MAAGTTTCPTSGVFELLTIFFMCHRKLRKHERSGFYAGVWYPDLSTTEICASVSPQLFCRWKVGKHIQCKRFNKERIASQLGCWIMDFEERWYHCHYSAYGKPSMDDAWFWMSAKWVWSRYRFTQHHQKKWNSFSMRCKQKFASQLMLRVIEQSETVFSTNTCIIWKIVLTDFSGLSARACRRPDSHTLRQAQRDKRHWTDRYTLHFIHIRYLRNTKGAVLTHQKYCGATSSHCCRCFQSIPEIKSSVSCRLATFLNEPVALPTWLSSNIYFSQDLKNVNHDFRSVKPVFCTTVPKTLERMYEIQEKRQQRKRIWKVVCQLGDACGDNSNPIRKRIFLLD